MMKINLKEILKTKTIYQSATTTSAIVLSGTLGALFYAYLARFLGPDNFGIFSVVTVTIALLADIANVGTDTGIVRFVGEYRKKDITKALKFIKFGLEVKLIVGTLLLLLGWQTIPWVAQNFLAKPELTYILRYALLGAFGILLFSLTTSAIQAFEKFLTWGVLNISLNLLRLIGIMVLVNLNLLSVENSLKIYVVFPFIGFIVGSFFLPNYLKVKRGYTVASEFLQYNKWIALFVLIAALSTRLDTYLSTKILTLHDLGIYSAAVMFASVGTQIVSGIATVVAPKLTSFQSKTKAIIYLKKLQIFVILLALLELSIGIPIAYLLIPTLLGLEFIETIRPFIVLLFAQAVFLISIPTHSTVFYYFSYPKLFVWTSLIHLTVIGGLGWVLISSYGYLGAAYTVLIGNISNFVIPGVWVLNRFSQKK